METSRLKPRIPSRIEGTKIRPPMNLEVIVTDHCNITCRQCNHISPIMRKWNADVDLVETTLNRLSKVYHCDRLRLLGGEPLLHPRFVELVRIAKRSAIGEVVQLTTNGMLLDQLSDEGWDTLDEIELSLYELSGRSPEWIAAIQDKGKVHGTIVNVARYPNFRMTFTARPAENPALVEDVWQACKMANVWGCHALRGNRIYRCPQSIYAPTLNGGSMEEEGFAITNSPSLRDELLSYLNAPGPLKSCSHCVGSSGRQFLQEGMARKVWRNDLDSLYKDLIDYELLERSKIEEQKIDDCRSPLETRSKRHNPIGKIRTLLTR